MFCAYCRRLFSFQQPVQRYQPAPSKRRHNVLQGRGNSGEQHSTLRIEQSPQVTGDDESKFEVYEDTPHIFAPRLLWFKTLIGKEGLKDGETHDPSGKCQICNMVFSNVSGSFVEALIRQQGGKGGEMGFVYQLKGEAILTHPEPVLSVWLEVGEKLVPMIKLKISAGNYSKSLPGVFPSRVESTNTGSVETLSLAASWINHCDKTHAECARIRAHEHRLPTRLIDVGTSDGRMKPHLFIPSTSTPFTSYTTLSYRWGPSPSVLLTKDSLSSLLEEIPFHLLPKTNQDAILITRFLGVKYLWIDALCIIQDLEGDWHKESGRMGDIYKDSYFTISASMAETGSRGCFVERGPLQACFRTQENGGGGKRRMAIEGKVDSSRKIIHRNRDTAETAGDSMSKQLMRRKLSRAERKVRRPYDETSSHKWYSRSAKGSKKMLRDMWLQRARMDSRVTEGIPNLESRSKGPEMTIRTFQTDLWASEVDASPLSRRAWTLQERLLSPRILHFGKSQLFFECLCSRACETWPQPATRKVRRPFEEEAPVGFNTEGSDGGMNGVIVHPLPDHWDEIVEMYTDANLTRPEDKLVAISGLVKEIQKETKDVYSAGLWAKDFERNLLWYLNVPQRRALEQYRAPSWSWASVHGQVAFLAKNPRQGHIATSAATVHTIRTIVRDGHLSPTGQVEDGFCRISGALRKVLRYERQAITHRLVLSEDLSDPYCYVDFFPDTFIKKEEFPVDVECLPILHYQNRMPVEENIIKLNGAFMAGLVIHPTGEFRDEYQRIGVFRIAQESGKEWFDPKGIEEKEVTII